MNYRKECMLMLVSILVLVPVIMVAGCTAPAQAGGNALAAVPGTVEKVEVYHFHRTQQCYSCRTVPGTR